MCGDAGDDDDEHTEFGLCDDVFDVGGVRDVIPLSTVPGVPEAATVADDFIDARCWAIMLI